MTAVGIDIVEVNKIKLEILFIERILHKDEIKILNTKNNETQKRQFLAGRWAVKEALFKTGHFNNVNFNEINIKYNENKQPYVVNLAKNIKISLSHSENYAVGLAFLV